jgi:hypothetical protein
MAGELEKQVSDIVTFYTGGAAEPGLENINRLLATYPLLGSLLEREQEGRGLGGEGGRSSSFSALGAGVPLLRANSFDSCASTLGDGPSGGAGGDAEAKEDDEDALFLMDDDDSKEAESPRGNRGRQDSVNAASASEGEFVIASRRPIHSGAILGAVADSELLAHKAPLAHKVFLAHKVLLVFREYRALLEHKAL